VFCLFENEELTKTFARCVFESERVRPCCEYPIQPERNVTSKRKAPVDGVKRRRTPLLSFRHFHARSPDHT
jgi:hypothetical protein